LDGDPLGGAWTALERSVLRPSRRGLILVEDRGRRRPSSLWSLIHVLWAACDLADLGRTVPIEELAALLGRYRRGDGYAATPHGRHYFDDSAWLGLVSLRLARITGEVDHQARARELVRFVQTGEDLAGGIRWRRGLSTRNTCSTAASAWLAMLADGSQDRAFAERVMGWLISTLRRPDGTFADRIDDGVVEPTVWSYNQGAAVAALRLIGRAADADSTARASIEIFEGERRWSEPPPFLAIWFRALADDPTVGGRAIRSLREHVDRMLALAYDEDTRLFTRGGIGSYDGRTTIDQAAAIQLLALREATA
jgi:hypothetical protein